MAGGDNRGRYAPGLPPIRRGACDEKEHDVDDTSLPINPQAILATRALGASGSLAP
jgi:hypothetical protein